MPASKLLNVSSYFEPSKLGYFQPHTDEIALYSRAKVLSNLENPGMTFRIGKAMVKGNAKMTSTTQRIGGEMSIEVTNMSLADLDEAVTILSKGEGYSGTSATFLLEPHGLRSRLLPFVESRKHGSWKATIADNSGMAGLLFFLHSNRLDDVFDSNNVLGKLEPSLFPPGGDFIQIYELWVSSEFRRLGIATVLKQRLEQYAQRRKIAMVYTVTEEQNQSALSLNRKLGYVPLFTGPMWDEVPRTALAKYLGDNASVGKRQLEEKLGSEQDNATRGTE